MNTPLTIDHLKEKGFDLIPFREPSQSCGIDLFHGWDYAIKKIGNKTHLELRVRNGIIKVDGFYSSMIETLEELNFLIDILAGEKRIKTVKRIL